MRSKREDEAGVEAAARAIQTRLPIPRIDADLRLLETQFRDNSHHSSERGTSASDWTWTSRPLRKSIRFRVSRPEWRNGLSPID
jgi:hypothetical protein